MANPDSPVSNARVSACWLSARPHSRMRSCWRYCCVAACRGGRCWKSRAVCCSASAARPVCWPPVQRSCGGCGSGPGAHGGVEGHGRVRAAGVAVRRGGADALSSPEAVRDYLRLTMAPLPYEAFLVIFLDSQNRLLAARELFRGTLAQTSVYPREVVKAALEHNAAAVILAHNHPSGVAEPSRADELLTQSLKQALALVDIRTLDHFIVAGARVVSFAERGLI